MSLRNYVAIRFSVRISSDATARAYGDESNRPRWFEMRAKYFRDWAVRSLDNQTVAPRRVFVLMDPSDKPLWEEHLNLPFPYEPVYASYEGSGAEVVQRVRRDGGGKVLLSRMDSDDAIARDYLERLNETALEASAAGMPVAFIVACNGFVTDFEKIQTFFHNYGPWLSIFAEDYDDEDILAFEHTKVVERSPLYNETALWMQVQHGSNLANRSFRVSSGTKSDRLRIAGAVLPVAEAWPIGFLHIFDPRDQRAVPAARSGGPTDRKLAA